MKQTNPQSKQLFRSRTNYVVFGICGGLGEYFGIDPLIIRIILVVLTLSAGSGLLLYIVLAFLIPRAPEESIKESSASIDLKERTEGLVSELKALVEKYTKQ